MTKLQDNAACVFQVEPKQHTKKHAYRKPKQHTQKAIQSQVTQHFTAMETTIIPAHDCKTPN